MVATNELWRRAYGETQGFLRRYGDAWTRSYRDDVVQEAALAAWRWATRRGTVTGDVAASATVGAAMRTIARRVRCRALLGERRRRAAHAEAGGTKPGAGDARPGAARPEAGGDEPRLQVAGVRVPLSWLTPHLQRALATLRPRDRQLLLSFHEGFCCAELALRFDSTEQRIRMRIHRARRRVREVLEDRVRIADDLEVWSTTTTRRDDDEEVRDDENRDGVRVAAVARGRRSGARR